MFLAGLHLPVAFAIIKEKTKKEQTMKIYSVYDREFKAYGQVVTGLDAAVREILEALEKTPLEQGVNYVAEEPILQQLPAATEIAQHLYGGMPVQLGWCNGYNTKLNCLEYHRDSEYNMTTRDVVMLFAKQDEIEDGVLDTAKVKAFHLPAGVMIECFATTLHYAPCSKEGYRGLVALPRGTNLDKPVITEKNWEDKLLFACNKWLLAHKDAAEASQGAYVGLVGENLDLKDQL